MQIWVIIWGLQAARWVESAVDRILLIVPALGVIAGAISV